MNTNKVIRVEKLSKQYSLGWLRPKHDTLRDALVGGLATPFDQMTKSGRQKRQQSGLAADTIWALRDVSFEVERGQAVGIIGANGAGKTTLLRILSRITEPTEGWVDIYGRVGSLLEVGTGFHPELTGRENVYLNGAILGMKHSQINGYFDKIVEFAGIADFLDTPLKHYSSGMSMRLGFAIAAYLEPAILLVDEVLAVGDISFQKKCLGKMREVATEGRTVLFVSHNLAAIRQLCQHSLWIDRGKLRLSGPTDEVISSYLTHSTGVANHSGEQEWPEGISNPDVDEFKLKALRVKSASGKIASTLGTHESFQVDIEYEIRNPLPHCRVGFVMTTASGIDVFETYDDDPEQYAGSRQPGVFVSECSVPQDLLSPGRYSLTFSAGIDGIKNLARLENVLWIDIEDTGTSDATRFVRGPRTVLIRPRLDWHRRIATE